MEETIAYSRCASVLCGGSPCAAAWINGSEAAPDLAGVVKFYEAPFGGVVVAAEMTGLPDSGFYGMHIHEFGDCTPPFDKTGEHYNPEGVQHPSHAGDLLPLFGNDGYAWSAFYDNRLTLSDIIQKSVVVHMLRDDFTSQPSGASGKKIGCGVIARVKNNVFI